MYRHAIVRHVLAAPSSCLEAYSTGRCPCIYHSIPPRRLLLRRASSNDTPNRTPVLCQLTVEDAVNPASTLSPPGQRLVTHARRMILLATHRRSRFERQDGILVPLFSISRFITVQAQPVFGCVDGCHTCLLLSGCPALYMTVNAFFRGLGGHSGKTPHVRCLANSSRQSVLFKHVG